jgi:hypothetical protein
VSDPASGTRFIDALGQVDGSPPPPGERIKTVFVFMKPRLEALMSFQMIAGACSSPCLSLKCIVSLLKDRVFLVLCHHILIVFNMVVQVLFSGGSVFVVLLPPVALTQLIAKVVLL